MESKFTRELMIDPSMTDAEAKLSCHKAFMLFMDIASEHAERLDIGTSFMMRRKMFWLTVKSKIHIYRRPYQSEIVSLSTWPEIPEKMRCNRSYAFTKGEETLVAGKTQWAIMETDTGKLHPIADVYPEGIEFMDSACADDFATIKADFEHADYVEEYVVRSTDIDLGRHMNNTAYVRVAFDTFSNKEIKAMDIRTIDTVFLAPCLEGDRLEVRRIKEENGFSVQITKDGKTAFLMQAVSE